MSDSRSPFVDASFSFDGQNIVGVFENGKASLWRWSGGRLVKELNEAQVVTDFPSIKSVTANPTRPIFIFLAEDGRFLSWDYRARKKLDRASGKCEDDGPQIKFNASGSNFYLLCGEKLTIFDFDTGAVKQLPEISKFSMAGNRTRFLTYSHNQAQLWDAKLLTRLNAWKSEPIVDAWLNFKGDRVFETFGTSHPKDVGGQPGTYRVRIKDSSNGRVIVDDLLTQSRTFEVEASGQGEIFATGGDEGIKVWSNQQAPAVIQQLDGEGRSFDFLANGLLLVEDGKKLTAWQYVTETRLGHYYTAPRAVLHWRDDHTFLDENSDGSEILTRSERGDLLIWSLKPPMLVRANDSAAECIDSVVVARDAHLIAALGSFKQATAYLPSLCAAIAERNSVIIWDADSLRERRRLDLTKFGRLNSLSIDDAGSRILVTAKIKQSEDDERNLSPQRYEVVDLETGKTSLKNESGAVYASTMSSNGAAIAFSERDKISIVNMQPGFATKICELGNSSAIIGRLVYSEDLKKIALADATGAIWILEAADCKLTQVPISVGQIGLATDLKFIGQLIVAQLPVPSPDDSGASSNRLVIWSEVEKRLIFDQLPSATRYSTPMAIFSDRSRLVRASGPDGQRDVLEVDVGSQRDVLSFPIDFSGCCEIVALHLLNDDRELLTIWSDRNNTRMRVWRIFHSIEELKSYAKNTVPECIALEDRRIRGLDAEPPRWCIDLSKPPFDSREWKEWLRDKDAGEERPLPN